MSVPIATLFPSRLPTPTNGADGLTARHDLMELGGAEIARARRYGRPLALVALELRSQPGDAVSDDALTEQVAEAVLRLGADHIVRLEEGRFVAVLPETRLSGAMHLASRLQQRLAGAGVPSRLGFAALQAEDARFADLLKRAQAMVETGR